MRALVIGVDGTIGKALAARLTSESVEVAGTSRRRESQAGLFLDLETADAADWRPPPADIAIFCAAMAQFADCRSDPARAQRVNVSNPLAIARRLAQRGTRTILLSTSAVFGGSEPYVVAERPPAPSSVYGRLKAEAEAGFLSLGEVASVVRLTKVLTGDLPLLRNWVSALQRREPVRAFTDLTVSPITLDHAVACLAAIVRQPDGGIYQISGADDPSYAAIAVYLAKRTGVSENLVTVGRAVDQGISAEEVRPFSSLDASRVMMITGRSPPTWRSVIDAVYAEITGDRPTP